jgi:uncharacterized protein
MVRLRFLPRPKVQMEVARALAARPIVGLLGPRQCGKTTLARQVVASLKHTYFDLEDPASRRKLESPELTLNRTGQVVVIDEVQHMPELFPLLRVLVDREPDRRFLLLGSASPDLLRRSSESLAGRIRYVELGGFRANEVDDALGLWIRGGLPLSYLADGAAESLAWREDLIRTFLERDLGMLEIGVPSATMRRFWTMVAHYHGGLWNGAEFGSSLGVSAKTARRYVDVLEATFMVRQLRPWWENVGKRLVKAPKIYVRDTGLLHALLGLETWDDVIAHPKAGLSWEGFALEEVLAHVKGDPYFWRTHTGAELDLLMLRRKERWGFEFKLSGAPKLTPSMRFALGDLKLDHIWVVHAGTERISLSRDVTAIPLAEVPALGD